MNERERLFTVAGSASDVRAAANARADIRRMLRAIGLIGQEERPAPARQLSKLELLEQRLQHLEAQVARMSAPAQIAP